MCRVSIIMGVYNCRSYELLVRSVKSVIGQSYENWEFIICDDGSVDNTSLWLQSIQKMDSRIKVIGYKANSGLACALNKCIEISKGEFIARQDDDDFSEFNRLEKQIEFLDKNKTIDFVGTKAYVYDDNGIWGNYWVKENPSDTDFLWNSPFLHPSIMFRKESLLKVNGYRVAPETRRCEDYDLFMRMYSVGMKGHNLQENLYQYRFEKNPNTKYRTITDRYYEAMVRYQGFKSMGILGRGFIYVFKPILIGLMPHQFFETIKYFKTNFKRYGR